MAAGFCRGERDLLRLLAQHVRHDGEGGGTVACQECFEKFPFILTQTGDQIATRTITQTQ